MNTAIKLTPPSSVKASCPLIQCLTNYVTVNDCANMLIACGAAPIMAGDINEVAEIAAISSGQCLNIGTLSPGQVEAMVAAGKAANEHGRAVVLDPVGAGASRLRTDAAGRIAREVKLAAIRGNISELKCMAGMNAAAKGVDAAMGDELSSWDSVLAAAKMAKTLAASTGSVIAISGEIDVIADGARAFAVRNGHALMPKVSGTGCMLSTVTAAYIAANAADPLLAAVSAFVAMGVSGEIAAERLAQVNGGYSTYRALLIDAMSLLDDSTFEARAKVEEVK